MSETPTVVNIPTEAKETSFHFKKEKIRDPKGSVIGEGKKLPSLKLNVPVPTAEGVLEIVKAGGKELELLLSACADTVYGRLRTVINEVREKLPADAEIKPEMIDLSQASWSVIASIPKAQRAGLGISDEDWNDFAADYRAIMAAATGKDADRIEKHIQLFQKKFAPCRNDKKALGVLKEMLAVWAANTGSMEDNQTVYEYLSNRVDSLLAEEEKILSEAL
jgi:hypothetical protein